MPHDPPLDTITRDEIMTRMRRVGISDSIIGTVFKLSPQRIHMRLGPRPIEKRKVNPPKPGARLDNLPDYLKNWRERHNLSIRRAARAAGTNQVSWWKWEQNLADCSMPALLLRYLALLDEHPDRIKQNNSELGIDMDV
jgi:DNA-binding transcriptional regulator YiaG